MQIVIDIPEKDVPSVQAIMPIDIHFIAGEVCGCSYPYEVLPKRHGRLIDADAAKCSTCGKFGCKNSDLCELFKAKTIIEADGSDVE